MNALTEAQILRKETKYDKADKIELTKKVKSYKIGFKDDHELNTFNSLQMSLDTKSYQFYDYQFYISNGDSTKNNYKLFYRERFDQTSDSSRLTATAKAVTKTATTTTVTTKKNSIINRCFYPTILYSFFTKTNFLCTASPIKYVKNMTQTVCVIKH